MQKVTMKSRRATIELGQKLAKYLQRGDVIVLNGDLGAGKTTFTKGIAAGLGVPDMVKSPTFTIIREYQNGRLPLYHMDVYRLEHGGGEDLGLEEYFDGDGVCVVEWAEYVADELPDDFLVIHFKRTDDENKRVLEFSPHGEHYQKLVDQTLTGMDVENG